MDIYAKHFKEEEEEKIGLIDGSYCNFPFDYSAGVRARGAARVRGPRTQADTSLIVLHLRYLALELTRKSEVSSRFPPSGYLRFIEKTAQAQSISA